MSLRVCLVPGCPALTTQSRCERHRGEHERARGTSTARGYDYAHQQERAAWAPLVATGTVRCRRGATCNAADLFIHPGEPWDLGHPDSECSAPKAPEHEGCNRATAGRQETQGEGPSHAQL